MQDKFKEEYKLLVCVMEVGRREQTNEKTMVKGKVEHQEVVSENGGLSENLESAGKSMYGKQQQLSAQENSGKNSEELLGVEFMSREESDEVEDRYRTIMNKLRRSFEEAIHYQN